MRRDQRVAKWTSDKRDREYGKCIGVYIFFNELNSVLQHVAGFTGNSLSIAKLTIALLCFFMITRCLIHLKKKEWMVFILLEVVVTLMYIYSLIVGVSFLLLSEWAITSLGICIPLSVLAYSIKNKETMIKQLFLVSWPILALLLIDTAGRINTRYDIHFAHIFMFVIIIHLNQYFNSGNRVFLIVSLIEMVIILIYGSRGALLSVLVFICIKILINDASRVRKVAYISTTVFLAIGVYYIFDNYGYAFLAMFQELGFNSRSLRLLLLGNFTSHDSGRSILWETTWNLINEHPILGWGIRGAADKLGHPYPHNFFLDFWLSFGYIFGTILMIASLIPMRRMFTLKIDKSVEAVHIFFSCSMVILMISGTWFINFFYFIYMGLIVSKNNIKNEVN